MSDEIKKAIRKMAKPGGFDATLEHAIVKSVDKNNLTCVVELMDDESILEDVKLKPVWNDGDLTKMGLVLFPAPGSFVIIGQINNDNTDLVVLNISEVESITMDTQTAFKCLLNVGTGQLELSAAKLILNGGNNAGIPLVKPLTKVVNDLQKQVNELIDAFKAHTHPGIKSGAEFSLVTTKAAPAKTVNLIQVSDIENKKVSQ